MKNNSYKRLMKKTPWVQCPTIDSVQQLLTTIPVTNYTRGSGQATERLDYLESLYRVWVKDIIDLSDFTHCYFVNGVTDAINQWVATETRTWQYLHGDYEYANMIGGDGYSVSKINPEQLLYISNPACETGNFISLDNIDNPVILDCAYIGSTDIKTITPPKNTEQVWFSFSKGWGLIGQRSGLVFTKEPHRSLHIMKAVEGWNYTSVETSIAIVENYDIDTVYNQYKQQQQEACAELDITPSDCFFIANSTHPEYSKRRRANEIARLDLSTILQDK
jgi:hypothetical protein